MPSVFRTHKGAIQYASGALCTQALGISRLITKLGFFLATTQFGWGHKRVL